MILAPNIAFSVQRTTYHVQRTTYNVQRTIIFLQANQLICITFCFLFFTKFYFLSFFLLTNKQFIMKKLQFIPIFLFSILAFSCKNETVEDPLISICGTVTDIDGNVQNTVTIGNQCWMAENLRTTRYNNDSLITNVTNNSTWAALRKGAYCVYDLDPGNR